LDKANESANPNYDFDSPTTQRAETSFGTSCQYVVGLDDPEDISGGYLLEMEMENRIDEEVSWFSTKGGDYLLTKSPECATKAQLEYVSSLYQQFEDAVYNGGINPDTGKSYTEYMDLDSLVRCYLIMELSGNSECFLNSTYFYLPQGSDVFYAGPLWDYDLAYCVKSTEIRAGQSNLGRELLRLSDFCARAREIYEEEFLPIINSALSDGGAIDRYAQTLASSASMNFTLWPYTAYGASAYGGQSFQGNVDYLENYIRVRSEFLSEALQALPAQFDDVAIDAWYFPYVSRMYANGFINGTDKKTFSPNASLTRAQAVEMLYRMYGSDTDYSGIYSDIPDGLYYSRSVVWASKNSLVQGYDGGVFYPDKAISREQLALILYRAAGQPEADTSILSGFSDSADISTYARSAVAWACEKGIIGGSGGKLNPKNSAMRSQCAKMLDTFYRLYPSIEIG
jgi:hypothetical protein